jgi:peptidoglycan/xylan/chitin deacetylase (PgdA/CDA1 family)
MTEKTILVSYGVEFDAVAGWLGSYGGEGSPLDISRGLFAGEVGVPRLLTLFERFGIHTTWFIAGHSIETFPEQAQMVVDAGHEIGLHGYSHEDPVAMTPQQEEAVLDRSLELVSRLSGQAPRGYVAPGWEFSPITAELLISRGVLYDHSLMHDDFHPYYVRSADRWTKIDYSQPADSWMKPLQRGTPTSLIEIPANWHLDDMVPLRFMKNVVSSQGLESPRVVEEIWRDTFDWVYRENDYAVFPMTIHPDVSARPQTLLMHERLFDYMHEHAGVHFVTMNEIAEDFARREPPPG